MWGLHGTPNAGTTHRDAAEELTCIASKHRSVEEDSDGRVTRVAAREFAEACTHNAAHVGTANFRWDRINQNCNSATVYAEEDAAAPPDRAPSKPATTANRTPNVSLVSMNPMCAHKQ